MVDGESRRMESNPARHRNDSSSTRDSGHFLPRSSDTRLDPGDRHSRKNGQNADQEYDKDRKPHYITNTNQDRRSYEDQQAYTDEYNSSTRQSRRRQEQPPRALQRTRQRPSLDHQIDTPYQSELLAQDDQNSGHSTARHYDLSSSYRSRPIAVPRHKLDDVREDDLEIPERRSRHRRDSYAESPRSMGRSPQSFTELPRYRSDSDRPTLDRHGRVQRRDSDDQHDSRTTSSRQGYQRGSYSESPRHMNRTYGDMNQMVQGTAALSMSPRNADVVATSPAGRPPRRGSSNSLLELAQNKYDFEAIIVTESVDRYGDHVRHHERLNAVVDTGCDDDVVLESVLGRAGIDPNEIKDIGRTITFEGFEGMKYKIRKRVRLTWGKKKHQGQRTRRDYFLIVKELPGKAEMVLGRDYLTKEIERYARRQNSTRVPSQEEDEEFEDWVVLDGPDEHR